MRKRRSKMRVGVGGRRRRGKRARRYRSGRGGIRL